ncbi:MAG TPA: extracellular solute-binding protein [Verrucomicrobiae bacterium]|nr:extracellular solute-binding protein [Verrucomicrobiae bacterium]
MLTRRLLLKSSLAAGALTGLLPRQIWAQGATPVHAMAMHGDPKYGPDFPHFEYVNPDAPKGGELVMAAIGTFDTFNGFIIKGTPAVGLGSVYETLTTGSADEAFSRYGLLAESMEMPNDRSWIAFNLRPEARWHDGKPVTAEDVIFSFDTLKEKGDPFFRVYYQSVVKAEKTGDKQVKFVFDGKMNRELPLIIGEITVLPKHAWEGRDFETPDLVTPLGSGPYRINSFEAGRRVTYERVADYWGVSLPANLGQSNPDKIRYEYYRDPLIAFEAFKAGEFDFRAENSAKLWATGYDIPQVTNGLIIKEKLPDESTQGMQCMVFNTRREIFKDPIVRQAINYAFDFEWTNKTLFYDQYTRTKSYWAGGELASKGLPQGEELEILERYRGKVPEEVFTTEYIPPTTDGSGNNRANLRTGAQLLKSAGWEVKGGVLTNAASGKALEFEFLLVDALFERITQPIIQNLERLGIKAKMRTVDPAQFQNRVQEFDFDVIQTGFGQSESPGNEQRDFWGSASADVQASRNTIGVKDPVIDELIELIIAAETRESLIARTHALDRVLLWHHFVLPQWHLPADRIVYWDKFSRPAVKPKYGIGFNTWWIDAEKASALAAKKTN